MSELGFEGLGRFTGLWDRGNKGNRINRGSDFLSTSNAKTVHYSGPFIYEDNDLKCIFTSAGRLTPVIINGNVLYKFEYNLTDHLGNVRVTFGGHSSGGPEVLQVTDYDPFGLMMAQQNFVCAENSMLNKYLYNGKELQDDVLGGTALDWYDYGARIYDPKIGRWHSVDPAAELNRRWSPYTYAINNPLRFIDPDGNNWWDVVNGIARGVVDNTFGSCTRASYAPSDKVQYNRVLNEVDVGLMVTGVMITPTGGSEAAGG